LGPHLPEVEVSAVRIEAGSAMVGRSLVELALRKKYGVTVLAVRRDGQTIPNPEVDMPFGAGDVLYVMGLPGKLAASGQLFRRRETEGSAAVAGKLDNPPA
jgi:CPA2 family monovalent cation:H+ antiporter-2